MLQEKEGVPTKEIVIDTPVEFNLDGEGKLAMDIPRRLSRVNGRVSMTLGTHPLPAGIEILREAAEETMLRGRNKKTRKQINKAVLYEKQKGRCAACGIQLPLRHFTLDHVTPRSKGGKDKPSNLILLCMPCNQDKGDRIVCVRDMRRDIEDE
jgi:hypothetical protein